MEAIHDCPISNHLACRLSYFRTAVMSRSIQQKFANDTETRTFRARGLHGFRNIDFQSVSPAGLQPAVAERRKCPDSGEHLPLGAQGKALCSGADVRNADYRSLLIDHSLMKVLGSRRRCWTNPWRWLKPRCRCHSRRGSGCRRRCSCWTHGWCGRHGRCRCGSSGRRWCWASCRCRRRCGSAGWRHSHVIDVFFVLTCIGVKVKRGRIRHTTSRIV
jgi:hypothetical protein